MGLKQFSQKKDQRPRGGWLWLARLALLIGVGANVLPTLIGLPNVLANFQDLGSTGVLDDWGSSELIEATTSLGISVSFVATTILVADFLIVVVYWSMAILLLLRYSDRWFGLIVPYILFGLAVGFSFYPGEAWNTGITIFAEPIRSVLEIAATVAWPAFFFAWFIFPDGRFVPRWAWISVLGAPLIFVLGYVPELYEYFPWILALIFAFVVLGLVAQIYRYARVSNLAQKQQTKWVIFGLTLFLLTQALSFLDFGSTSSQRLLFILVALSLRAIGIIILPIALAISLTRFRLWDVDELVNRAFLYGVLTTFFAAIFAASTVIINQISLSFFGEQSAMLAPVISAVVVASIFQPSRKRLEDWVEKRFYPQKKELVSGLVETDPGFWPFISLPKLLESSLAHLSEHLHAKPLAAFLLVGDGRLKPAAALGIPAKTLPALKLTRKQSEEFKKKRVAAMENNSRFSGLVPLAVPAKANGLVGVIALGPRMDGRGYSGEDLKTLVELGGKIALAVHAVQVRTGKKGS